MASGRLHCGCACLNRSGYPLWEDDLRFGSARVDRGLPPSGRIAGTLCTSAPCRPDDRHGLTVRRQRNAVIFDGPPVRPSLRRLSAPVQRCWARKRVTRADGSVEMPFSEKAPRPFPHESEALTGRCAPEIGEQRRGLGQVLSSTSRTFAARSGKLKGLVMRSTPLSSRPW